jgi:radical SAM protein with 4Fe4S-binding SPASM domain
MSKALCELLFQSGGSVIVKYNSVENAAIQDTMVGCVRGTHDRVQRTIDMLLNEGFAQTQPTRLAVESVISQTNVGEIEKIFRYARRNNIYPYLELVTPAGRGKEYPKILCREEARDIFHELASVDEHEFGYSWVPRPPRVADNCTFYETGVYINAEGKVQPCPTVDMELGDLKQEKLKDVLSKDVTRRVRNIRENIEGKCQKCSMSGECYGCRGTAFNITGDIFAADPVCWM